MASEAQRERQRRYRARNGPQKSKGVCSIDECPRGARARGMCTTHLERIRKHGDPLLVAASFAPGATEEDRLWAQVREYGDCWLYTGSANNRDGYARMGRSGRMVHRIAYEQMVGDIPDGLDLDHVCHNEDETCLGGPSCLHRVCVNPYHADPVPRSVNSARRWDHERRCAS